MNKKYFKIPFLIFRHHFKEALRNFLAKCPKWVNQYITEIRYALKGERYAKIGSKHSRWTIKALQLEITYRCNLSCIKCDRHCNLVGLPYLKDAEMSIEQIRKLIFQIKQKKKHLSSIAVLCGEPLLHSSIIEIISMLFYDLLTPGYIDYIVITTNGILLDEKLKKLLTDPNLSEAFANKLIRIYYEPPPRDKGHHWALAAPVDLGLKWDTCEDPRRNGILLNCYGYWPGGPCGAIARLFRQDQYAKYDFPDEFEKTWPGLRKDLCKYCVRGSEVLMSKKTGTVTISYKNAIMKWMKDKNHCLKKF